jgi:hypothetical protein
VPRTEDLAYWINEREAMRKRREPGGATVNHVWKYGWSDDPHMGLVRYCNVHREDDKVTRWITKNWRNPNWNHPNLTLAMVMARMINNTDTLAVVDFPSLGLLGLDDQRRKMIAIKGKKWTSAYTISTCGRSMGKEDYVFGHVLRQVAAVQWDWDTYSLGECHSDLMRVDGLGSFLAAQVVADLKNTPGHPLSKAPDWWTWSAHGPGSLKGLAAYHGAPVTPRGFHEALKTAYEQVHPLIGMDLHMQDFQNCMCEFSKYVRVKEGGRARNTYAAR